MRYYSDDARGGEEVRAPQFILASTSRQKSNRISSMAAKGAAIAYLGVGSNLGCRSGNISRALERLASRHSIRRLDTSLMYESAAVGAPEGDAAGAFLNAVVKVTLPGGMKPSNLLDALKETESELGRDQSAARNASRCIDLDILLYFGSESNECERVVDSCRDLFIPHPRMHERRFVLEPLCDVISKEHDFHPDLNVSFRVLRDSDNGDAGDEVSRVLPLSFDDRQSEKVWHWGSARCATKIMGILNVTPDSFSDGGSFDESVETAVNAAMEMRAQGASVIDIGGESTRPGADSVSIDEELQRVVPVINAIRDRDPSAVLSIDTTKPQVAREAVNAGANIINDISGGLFYDGTMLGVAAELGVPYILMHTRGTPKTMSSMTSYGNGDDEDLVRIINQELDERVKAAAIAGIPRWNIVIDPGIGFAKTSGQNLSILRHAGRFGNGKLPTLIGASRKGFLGALTGKTSAAQRDDATHATTAAAVLGGALLVRVHAVGGASDVAKVAGAIFR